VEYPLETLAWHHSEALGLAGTIQSDIYWHGAECFEALAVSVLKHFEYKDLNSVQSEVVMTMVCEGHPHEPSRPFCSHLQLQCCLGSK
jgi:hypothetical protein